LIELAKLAGGIRVEQADETASYEVYVNAETTPRWTFTVNVDPEVPVGVQGEEPGAKHYMGVAAKAWRARLATGEWPERVLFAA
jgi:hypothetical protein